jgi:molybdopterin converting factor small subunit
MGTYDNYNVLTRYSSVLKAYESGLSWSFMRTKKTVLQVESEYKERHKKIKLNITDKNNINDTINNCLTGRKNTLSSNVKYKFKPINTASTIKKLLLTDISKLDINIDWDNIDWNNRSIVNDLLSKVVDYIEEKDTTINMDKNTA